MGFQVKIINNIIQFKSTFLCVYFLAIFICYICFSMSHYFSLRDRLIPGRQKIAGETSGQTHLQVHSPVAGWAHFTQGRGEMVWCLKGQAAARDKHNPRRSGAREHPLEHSLVPAEASSTGCCERLSFYCNSQLDARKEWSRTTSLPSPGSPVQAKHLSGGVCPPHQTPNRLSAAEERRLIFLLSRAKPGHKLDFCKQRQVLNLLDNLLQIICPALCITFCEELGGLNTLEQSFT